MIKINSYLKNGITITELHGFFSCTINHNKKLIMGPKYIRGQHRHWDNVFQLNMNGIFGLYENCPWIQKHAPFVTYTIGKNRDITPEWQP